MTSQTRRYLASVAAAVAVNLVGQPAVAGALIINVGSTDPNVTPGLIFDGTQFQFGQTAVLVEDGKIKQVASAVGDIVAPADAQKIDVPGGTILPGFIDMHTHHLINNVPPLRMLEHGVTTARDLGSAEPIPSPVNNQPGQLRQFFSGPILQAPGGYPNVVFPGSGVEVAGEANVRTKVDSLVQQGASVIAVSIEKGGEFGSPWSWHVPISPPPWPTLTDRELKAIVDQAHKHHVRVTAYLGNAASARRALDARVDEWAHSPCDTLNKTKTLDARVIKDAGTLRLYDGTIGIAIDGTIDTEVACNGALDNAVALAAAGARLFYSTDMGHPDIPHGIDAQEIHMGIHVGLDSGKDYPTSLTQALASATGKAGEYLGLAPLGKIENGAPADLIVIGSNVLANFKELEFPRVVVKDGQVVIQRTAGQ